MITYTDNKLCLQDCTELFAILREHGYDPHFADGNIEINKMEVN